MISNHIHAELEQLADQAYWSINKPFERALREIGKRFAQFFPDRGRSSLLLWKNLDAVALRDSFVEELACPDFPVYTQRFECGVREAKNINDVKSHLLKLAANPPDAVVFLDVVAGTGKTAEMVKNVVASILPKTTFYFYCVFGSLGLRKKIEEWLPGKQLFLLKEYPMDETIDPPRLNWFVMTDLGDRYSERTSGGSLFETPFLEELSINESRLQVFDENRLRTKEYSGTLHEGRLIDRLGDLAIVGGALFQLQREDLHHTYKIAGQYCHHEWYSRNAILKLIRISAAEDLDVANYVGEINEDKKGKVRNKPSEGTLRWLLDHGYAEEKLRGRYWRFHGNFFEYFRNSIHPALLTYHWFDIMDKSAFNILRGMGRDSL